MDFETILSAISTVGFPIVACGAMYYMLHKTVVSLQTAVESNTAIMEKILTKLGE